MCLCLEQNIHYSSLHVRVGGLGQSLYTVFAATVGRTSIGEGCLCGGRDVGVNWGSGVGWGGGARAVGFRGFGTKKTPRRNVGVE